MKSNGVYISAEEAELLADCVGGDGSLDILVESSLLDKLRQAGAHAPDPDSDYFQSQVVEEYQHLSGDGDIDFDDTPVVSQSEDGAYVMMWGWVLRPETKEAGEENDA